MILRGAEERQHAENAFKAMGTILSQVGASEAEEKACVPSTRMEFLGNWFDTQNMTIEITSNRLQEIKLLVDQFLAKTIAKQKWSWKLDWKIKLCNKLCQTWKGVHFQNDKLLKQDNAHEACPFFQVSYHFSGFLFKIIKFQDFSRLSYGVVIFQGFPVFFKDWMGTLTCVSIPDWHVYWKMYRKPIWVRHNLNPL